MATVTMTLTEDECRYLFDIVMARAAREITDWRRYQRARAESPFTGRTPVPPSTDGSQALGLANKIRLVLCPVDLSKPCTDCGQVGCTPRDHE